MKTEYRELEKLFSVIREASRVCLFPHVDPDGDTLGSTLALQSLVKRMGKPVQIVMENPPPERMKLYAGI